MSSKRHCGESFKTSFKPSKKYDTKRFVSETTLECYHTVLAGMTLILERDLHPHETQSGDLAAMIVTRGWLEFTK